MGLMLLSRLNRDPLSTRTAELLLAGSLLCAGRTSEHKALRLEGREAASLSIRKTVPKCGLNCVETLRCATASARRGLLDVSRTEC